MSFVSDKKERLLLVLAAIMLAAEELMQFYYILNRRVCYFPSRRYSFAYVLILFGIYSYWGYRLFYRECIIERNLFSVLMLLLAYRTMLFIHALSNGGAVMYDSVWDMRIVSAFFLPVVSVFLNDMFDKKYNKKRYIDVLMMIGVMLVLVNGLRHLFLDCNNIFALYKELFKSNMVWNASLVIMIGFVLLAFILNQKSMLNLIVVTVIGIVLLVPINTIGVIAYSIVASREEKRKDAWCMLGLAMFLVLYYMIIKVIGSSPVL